MYRLEKRLRFEAAHHLPEHDGLCSNVHGHSFQLVLTLEGEELCRDGPKSGMLLDYGVISEITRPLLERLDHNDLNNLLQNPTSENLARWVYHQMKERLPLLKKVRVEETCTCACEYEP